MKSLFTKKIKKRDFCFAINLVLIAILLMFIFLLFKAKSYAYTVYTITLNSGEADSPGTTTLYVFNNNIYLDPSFSKNITATSNPITIPYKSGYLFLGYKIPSGNGSESGFRAITANGYWSSSRCFKLFFKREFFIRSRVGKLLKNKF